MPRKPDAEALEALRQKKAAIERRIAAIKTHEKRRQRAEDTRRKIVVGAAVLAHAEHDPVFAEALRQALMKGVTREADKVLLSDWLGSSSAPPQAASDVAIPQTVAWPSLAESSVAMTTVEDGPSG